MVLPGFLEVAKARYRPALAQPCADLAQQRLLHPVFISTGMRVKFISSPSTFGIADGAL